MLALFAAACGGKSSTANGGAGGGSADTTPDRVKPAEGPPKAGGTMTFAVEAESDGFDPTKNRWAASGTIEAMAVMDPLVALDKDFKPQPYLLQSFAPNADYTEWTFKLRPDVKFHDGTPFDAAALKTFIEAFKASLLTGSAARPVKSEDVVDPLTLKLTMSQPWAAYPALLIGQAGLVPSPSQLASPTGSANPVGTGPFVFKNWTIDKSFTVTKNPNYWRKGLPYLDQVDFKPIPDSGTRYNALQTNGVNVAVTSNEADVRKYVADADAGKLQVVRSRGEAEENLILLNTEQAPMNDLRVRQAMAYAIDKDALNVVAQTDPSLNAEGMFNTDSPWFHKTDYPTFNLDKAKELVKQYEADKGKISFVLGATTDPFVSQVANLVREQFVAAGMDVNVQTFEQSKYIENAVTGKFTAQLWRQFGAPDPDGDYVWFKGENASGPITLNMARNKDPELDKALDAQRATPDLAARQAAWATVQERMTADLPYLWLSHQRWAMGAGLNMRGIEGGTMPDGTQSAGLIGGVMRVTEMWMAS